MNEQATRNLGTSHEVFEAVCREHQALGGKVARIRQALEGDILTGEEIAAMLFDFNDSLKEHFSNEEFRGFFSEVTARAPNLNPEANKLCAEHLEMLHTGIELAQFAIAGDRSRSWWRELNMQFIVFADQLKRHEHDEDALLQRAYQEDIGVND
jgi:uncharacterized protein with von Willebrand factor type A (vWA) domain